MLGLLITSALAGEPQDAPMTLEIYGARERLDALKIIDDGGTVYSRREAMPFLAAETASAASAETYQRHHRRATALTVVSLIPVVGVAALPFAVQHHRASEQALREALTEYNTLGPTFIAEADRLP